MSIVVVNKAFFRTFILGLISAPRASFSFTGDPVDFAGPSGLDTTGAPLPFPYNPGAYGGGLRLIVGVNDTGTRFVDDEITEYNATSQLNEVTTGGIREFVLSIRIESDSSGEAYELANVLRTRIRRAGAKASLQASNYALIRVGNARDLIVTWDNREISAANVEIFLATAVTDGIDPTNDGVWIETADIDGTPTL
jgi:hypothetical protein